MQTRRGHRRERLLHRRMRDISFSAPERAQRAVVMVVLVAGAGPDHQRRHRPAAATAATRPTARPARLDFAPRGTRAAPVARHARSATRMTVTPPVRRWGGGVRASPAAARRAAPRDHRAAIWTGGERQHQLARRQGRSRTSLHPGANGESGATSRKRSNATRARRDVAQASPALSDVDQEARQGDGAVAGLEFDQRVGVAARLRTGSHRCSVMSARGASRPGVPSRRPVARRPSCRRSDD